MTQEQYDNKKCPNKELPIIITHNSWKKKNPETGEIEDIILRYPNLLSKDLHPKKLSMIFKNGVQILLLLDYFEVVITPNTRKY